jgi:hypothetical protein
MISYNIANDGISEDHDLLWDILSLKHSGDENKGLASAVDYATELVFRLL